MTVENPDVRNFTPLRSYIFYHYDIDGKESEPLEHDDETSPKELLERNNKAWAMKMEIREAGHTGTVYYCATYQKKLFDPLGVDANKRAEGEFEKLEKPIFDLYINFLVTKKKTSLLQAERMFING